MDFLSQSLMGGPLDLGLDSTKSKIIRVGNNGLWAIMRNSSIGLRLSFKKKAMCASSFWAWTFLFFKMTEWVPRIGLGF